MADSIELVVLAGGLGTRLRNAVPDLPKPMAPVLGKPFLERLLDYWVTELCSISTVRLRQIVLSVGYKSEAIEAHFGSKFKDVPISYAQELTPLGTGGGIFFALMNCRPDSKLAFVINGDTFLETDVKAALEMHLKIRAFIMALREVPQNDRYSCVEMEPSTGKVISMQRRASPHPTWINGGVYLMDPHELIPSQIKSKSVFSFEDEIIPAWISEGKNIFAIKTYGKFIDIGTPEDWKRAETFFS